MHVVAATNLNLRSAPSTSGTNRLTTLPQGHAVEKLADGPEGWWQVKTTVDGAVFTGFVASRFLKEVTSAPPPAAAPAPASRAATPGVKPVHLAENRADIRRDSATGRAFPLGEPGRPERNGATPAQRVQQLRDIVAYLNVEKHDRYLAGSNQTYCNIYAYDYCYLAGAYLPRVWWTGRALSSLATGADVRPKYDDTVREMNANALYDWLRDFGSDFGWTRVATLAELQSVANDGGIGIICAQRKDLNRSGHICAVVPEQAPAHTARRADGDVQLPLQSQAGTKNFCFSCGTTRWWAGDQFRAFGFWTHA